MSLAPLHPLAILARQYLAPRDSFAPLIDDLLPAAAGAESGSGRLGHARARIVAGSGQAMAVALAR